MQKYYGVFKLTIDDENQVVKVELKNDGPDRLRLPDSMVRKLRVYVLARAAEFGYPVVEA